MAGSGRSRTLKSWAEELGCSVETLRRAIRNKELLAVKDPVSRGPQYVVTTTDMTAFLAKRRSG